MNPLVSLLEAEGEMEFSAFVSAARAAGLRPDTWVRLKHQGLLHTRIGEDGTLYIAAGAAEVEA